MTYNPNPAKRSWNDSMSAIRVTLDKWGATNAQWKCAMSNEATGVARNHWSYSNWPQDKVGVVLTFTHKDGSAKEIKVSKFDTPRDNLWAIAKGIEDIRLNELRGLDDIPRQFYPALPSPVAERDAHEVLGIRPDAPASIVEAAYRTLAKEYHPDKNGGDAKRMKELNEAYEKLKSR